MSTPRHHHSHHLSSPSYQNSPPTIKLKLTDSSPFTQHNQLSTQHQYQRQSRQQDENEFQQMISNQQMQHQNQNASAQNTPRGRNHSKRTAEKERRSTNHRGSRSTGKQRENRHTTEKENINDNLQQQLQEQAISAAARTQQITEETFLRKNRVLEEISRRYETQIEQLTFTIHQKDQFFERQKQQWHQERAQLKKEYEARQNDLQAQIDALVKQHRMDLASSIGTNPHVGAAAGGASQIAAGGGIPAGSGWIGMSDLFQNSKSQNMTNSHLLASQLSAQRSSQHRRVEKLERKNAQLQEQLLQANEKLERAENLVKLLEQQKKDVEKKSEKLKSKYDRDKELNQMKEVVKSVQKDAQKTLDQSNKLKNENHELKKLNSQLKKMNERYFSVLRALNESEKVVHQKDAELHQLTEKYQRLSKRYKQSMTEQSADTSIAPDFMDSRKQHSTIVVQRHEHSPVKQQALHV